MKHPARHLGGGLLLALALLGASGYCWLLLHYLLATPGEFGLIRHPLEGPLLSVHGLVALVALFLSGGFAARHAQPARSGLRRASGIWLAVTMAVLAAAGCLQLFVTGEALQAWLSAAHQVLGVALLLPLLAHGWRFSPASRGRGPRAAHRPHAERGPLAHRAGRPPRNARS